MKPHIPHTLQAIVCAVDTWGGSTQRPNCHLTAHKPQYVDAPIGHVPMGRMVEGEHYLEYVAYLSTHAQN